MQDDKDLAALKALAQPKFEAWAQVQEPPYQLHVRPDEQQRGAMNIYSNQRTQHTFEGFAAALELDAASRCRAQGGNTCAESVSPAVDLSGLTRYYMGAMDMQRHESGKYVKLADVQALLAAPARDVGGLTYLFYRTLGTLALHDHKEAEKIGAEYRAIEREVLATKAAEPVQAEVRNALEQAARICESFCACDTREDEREVNGVLRARAAKIRSLATSPAPSVKQEASELPAILFDGKAVYDEITARLGKGHCFSADAVSTTLDAVVRLMRKDAAPSASQGEVQVPEGLTDYEARKQVAAALGLNGDRFAWSYLFGLIETAVEAAEHPDAARYRWLRDHMRFSSGEPTTMALRAPIPALTHDPHNDWVADRFDASVDRAIDAAMLSAAAAPSVTDGERDA